MERNNSNRRDFLKNSFLGVASLGVLGLESKTNNVLKYSNEYLSGKKIIYRTLGKTGYSIPVISMGVMNADLPELVRKSYDIGVRHFDTAAGYQKGKNEEMVGNVIKELGVRKKVIIATKASLEQLRSGSGKDTDPKVLRDSLLEIFKGSLKRLQMKYVEILYVHGLTKKEDVCNPGVLEALAILKKEKKIMHAGVSTHKNMAEVINELAKNDIYSVVLSTCNYTFADDKNLMSAFENASKKDIGIIAMKTQGGGRSKEINPNHPAMLKWALNNKFITTAIPGYTNYDQMNENFSVAYDLEYTPGEKQFLKERKVDIGQNFCKQCENCLGTCPKGVDIPTLMRVHMYAAQYSNFYQARDTYNEISSDKNLGVCSDCSVCNAKCARNLNIASRIDELKNIYC